MALMKFGILVIKMKTYLYDIRVVIDRGNTKFVL